MVERPTLHSLVVASTSPRRRLLIDSLNLAGVGTDVRYERPDVDEAAIAAGIADPVAAAVQISLAKVHAVVSRLEGDVRWGPGPALVLGADTLVVHEGVGVGKPNDDEDLRRVLGELSGRSFEVVTAVAWSHLGGLTGEDSRNDVVGRGAAVDVTTDVTTTTVELRRLDSTELEAYVRSGAGADKAGGLELQDRASHFIRTVRGCFTNVMGLPLCLVAETLAVPGAQQCTADAPSALCRGMLSAEKWDSEPRL